MVRKIARGTVVLAPDPYTSASGNRPFVIISDESYPFYPNGYLGVPLTRKDKVNTFELTDYDIDEQYEEFEKDSNFINPYSPVQVNEPGRALAVISDDFMDLLADRVMKAIGLKRKS